VKQETSYLRGIIIYADKKLLQRKQRSNMSCYFFVIFLLTIVSFSNAISDRELANTIIRENPFGRILRKGLQRQPTSDENPTPIVMWHGMGDTCCMPFSLGHVKKILEQEIPGVYVNSLQLGETTTEDFKSGYFADVNSEVTRACGLIANDSRLVNGYHAVGFSQGGQFLRAVAQRCPSPPMRSLVTLGAQHQGVFGLPHCPGESAHACDVVRRLLNFGAYTSWVQHSLVQAQYWHDPLKEEEYRTKSIFLADINNESDKGINQSYKTNLLQLKNLILVQFEDDTMVDPKESESFGWFTEGQAKEIANLTQTKLYLEDRIGIKQLHEEGRLIIYKVPGDHLQLDMDWFKSEIIGKFLKKK